MAQPLDWTVNWSVWSGGSVVGRSAGLTQGMSPHCE